MKKVIYIVASVILSFTMQAQNRAMPKPGPAPTVNIGKPETFTLKNGLKVLVVENHKLPRVSYTLTIDNAPYAEGDKKGVSDMVSALLGSGTNKMSSEAFNEEVDNLGANVSFWASGAVGQGLSKYSERILQLMADGALNPVFSQAEFDKEKAKILENLKAEEKNVPAIANRVTDILTYGAKHPSGEFVTEQTINNVTLQDVKQNYGTYYVPGKAYLVIVGDVKFKDVKKQVTKLFSSWAAGTAPSVSYSDPKDVQYTQVNFIDMPNAVQSEISVVNTVKLKMTDKEYFATLLANQILGGGGEGRLFLNLREAHGWTYGAYSSIGASRYVGAFTASTQVRNAVTDSSVTEILSELKKIRTDLVSAEDLANAKAKYIGNFVMQVEKPATIARYAVLTQTEGLPEDFFENYIKNISAVTAEDIKAAANKFFLAENARIVIVGKAADVLPGLEKTKIPVSYFDKFGKPTEKPVLNKPLPAGVTVKTVLDGYIKAVGGDKAVKAVKTVYTKSTGTVQGTPLELIMKVSADHKQMVEMKAMGMSMMKQVVNDKAGYMVQQGQKTDLTGEDLKDMQASAVPFEELSLVTDKDVALTASMPVNATSLSVTRLNSSKDMQASAVPFEELSLVTDKDVALTGIEAVNGAEAYAVKKGTTTYYYDVTSNLKIAEAKELEQGGQKMTQMTQYGDYKAVKGVKIPHKVVMNVGIEIELAVVEAKINEGVAPADFQ